MINLRISHRLQPKIDKLEMLPIKIYAAVKEAMIASVDDAREDIKTYVGDKHDWFDITYEEGMDGLKISASAETAADPEKMRLYNWFVSNYGDEMAKSVSECVKRNIRAKYKEHGLGDRYGY